MAEDWPLVPGHAADVAAVMRILGCLKAGGCGNPDCICHDGPDECLEHGPGAGDWTEHGCRYAVHVVTGQAASDLHRLRDRDDWHARALKAEATVAQLVNASYPDGEDDYVHEHGPDDGWEDCAACWAQTIRQLAGVAADKMPPYDDPASWEYVPRAMRPIEDHPLPPLPWQPDPELRAVLDAALAAQHERPAPGLDAAAVAAAVRAAQTAGAYRRSFWIFDAVRVIADRTLPPDRAVVVSDLGPLGYGYGKSYATIGAADFTPAQLYGLDGGVMTRAQKEAWALRLATDSRKGEGMRWL